MSRRTGAVEPEYLRQRDAIVNPRGNPHPRSGSGLDGGDAAGRPHDAHSGKKLVFSSGTDYVRRSHGQRLTARQVHRRGDGHSNNGTEQFSAHIRRKA